MTDLEKRLEDKLREVTNFRELYRDLTKEKESVELAISDIRHKLSQYRSEIDNMSPTIFIRYAREDETNAQQLGKQLKTQGFKVWIDKDSTLVGEQWEHAIKRGLERQISISYVYPSIQRPNVGMCKKELRMCLDLASYAERIDLTYTSAFLKSAMYQTIFLVTNMWICLKIMGLVSLLIA